MAKLSWFNRSNVLWGEWKLNVKEGSFGQNPIKNLRALGQGRVCWERDILETAFDIHLSLFSE